MSSGAVTTKLLNFYSATTNTSSNLSELPANLSVHPARSMDISGIDKCIRSITIMPCYQVKVLHEFTHWISSIRDGLTKRRLVTRLRKASLGNLGDTKFVGSGVWEMREAFGPGWRMYYTLREPNLVVMLGGGEKSSQQSDIAHATDRASSLEI